MVTVRPIERCRDCGAATVLLRVDDDDRGHQADPAVVVQSVPLAHNRAQCEDFQRLAREEWPSLFSAEAHT